MRRINYKFNELQVFENEFYFTIHMTHHFRVNRINNIQNVLKLLFVACPQFSPLINFISKWNFAVPPTQYIYAYILYSYVCCYLIIFCRHTLFASIIYSKVFTSVCRSARFVCNSRTPTHGFGYITCGIYIYIYMIYAIQNRIWLMTLYTIHKSLYSDIFNLTI